MRDGLRGRDGTGKVLVRLELQHIKPAMRRRKVLSRVLMQVKVAVWIDTMTATSKVV